MRWSSERNRCRRQVHLGDDEQEVGISFQLLAQTDADEVQRCVRAFGGHDVGAVEPEQIDSQAQGLGQPLLEA